MTVVRVDAEGLHLPERADSFAVFLDDRLIWQSDHVGERGFVPWPAALRPWLNGRTAVKVAVKDTVSETVSDLGEVRFGESEDRIRFEDEQGIALVVDKWGLVQRPFSSRQNDVRVFLAAEADKIVGIVARDCGIDLWMAFGTLLGAVREQGVIGSDSDVDLAYLSDQPSPAHMQLEMMNMNRALRRAGYRVIRKTGSFSTIRLQAPDGALATIDIYTCFYSAGMFLATATLRADVPVEAILPLQRLSFEGLLLPAPASPERLLSASYGPSWRRPDPSFMHRPDLDVVRRFDNWFGNWMKQRREWESFWWGSASASPPESQDAGARFAAWVLADLTPGTVVIDLGAGKGSSTEFFSRAGHRVWAIDYARNAIDRLRELAQRTSGEHRVQARTVNLYDSRDALSAATWLACRAARPRAIYCRHVVDAMPADARENLWRAAHIILSGSGGASGKLYAQFDTAPTVRTRGAGRFPQGAGRRWPVTATSLRNEWTAAGGRETHRHVTPLEHGGERWRVVISWP